HGPDLTALKAMRRHVLKQSNDIQKLNRMTITHCTDQSQDIARRQSRIHLASADDPTTANHCTDIGRFNAKIDNESPAKLVCAGLDGRPIRGCVEKPRPQKLRILWADAERCTKHSRFVPAAQMVGIQ